MTAILASLVICAAFLAIAYAGTRHPVVAIGRAVSISAFILAVAALVAGITLSPESSVWEAELAADASVKHLEAESTRAKYMIEYLGSPQAYIEYLKATKND